MANVDIHIAKAGKSAVVTVDTDGFSDETFMNILKEGLKACLNAKMSKIGPVTKLEGTELEKAQSAAMEIARRNLSELSAGAFKFPGTKTKTTESRDVLNEAMRIARDVIRDQLRAHNITISHVPAKDITAAAKSLVEKDPKYIAQAKEALASRTAVPTDLIDLDSLGLKPDPAKVEKAAKAKETRKENLSKTQAGKVKGRSKPSATPAAVLAAVTGSGPRAVPHVTH